MAKIPRQERAGNGVRNSNLENLPTLSHPAFERCLPARAGTGHLHLLFFGKGKRRGPNTPSFFPDSSGGDFFLRHSLLSQSLSHKLGLGSRG